MPVAASTLILILALSLSLSFSARCLEPTTTPHQLHLFLDFCLPRHHSPRAVDGASSTKRLVQYPPIAVFLDHPPRISPRAWKKSRGSLLQPRSSDNPSQKSHPPQYMPLAGTIFWPPLSPPNTGLNSHNKTPRSCRRRSGGRVVAYLIRHKRVLGPCLEHDSTLPLHNVHQVSTRFLVRYRWFRSCWSSFVVALENMLTKLRSRSSNSWVMLSPSEPFVRLPSERILYTSPPRTSFSLQTPNTYPGSEPLHLTSSTGTAYITNLRVRRHAKSVGPRLTPTW